MKSKSAVFSSCFLLCSILLSLNVFASSAYIGVHSIDNLGRANAGEVAAADSASATSKNPALIMRLEGQNIALGGAYVHSEWNARHSSSPFQDDNEAGGNNETGTFGPREVILPGLYYTNNLGKWGYGIALSTFTGGLLDYENDDFRHKEIADDTTLLTANTQLDLAYAFTSNFSVGVGIDLAIGYGDVVRHFSELSSPNILNQPLYGLIDLIGNGQQGAGLLGGLSGLLAENLPDLTAFLDPNKDLFEFRGTSFGYGWHAGLAYSVNNKLDIGFAYRSKVTHEFKGDYESDLPVLDRVYGVLGTDGKEEPAEFDIVQPALIDLGMKYAVNDRWELFASVSWQQWSDFQELKVFHGNGQEIFTKQLPHHDQFKYALGASYRYSPRLLLRGGVALDKSSTSEKNATITLPSSDRYWASVGFNYILNENSSLDFAFSYAKNDKIENQEKSLIVDVVFEDFPDATSVNDLLDIVGIDQNLGFLGDIPFPAPLPLNGFINSVYDTPYYEQEIEAELYFLGLQWNHRF